MFFHQRFIPGLAIYSYIVGDEKTKEAAVIDPTRDVDEFIEIAKREGLHIKHVLETHVHADFVSGSREMKDRLGDDVTIHASGMGGKDWTPAYADQVVQDMKAGVQRKPEVEPINAGPTWSRATSSCETSTRLTDSLGTKMTCPIGVSWVQVRDSPRLNA